MTPWVDEGSLLLNKKPRIIMAENYPGMTVNERLVASGLLTEFDEARKRKDKNAVVKILRSVRVGEESIREVLRQFGMV